MRKLLTTIFLFTYTLSFGQVDTFFSFRQFKLGKEKFNSTKAILKKLKKEFASNIAYYKEYPSEDDDPNYLVEFSKHLFKFDINNDGIDDLIYEGRAKNSDENFVKIFLGSSVGFKKVFDENQYIDELIFRDNKLAKLIISDFGCCMETTNKQQIFSVNFTAKQIFKLDYSRLTIREANNNWTNFIYKNHKPAKIIGDTSIKLRFEPLIDDSTSHSYAFGWDEQKGNILGLVDSGANVRTITELGQWHLIEIPAKFELKRPIIWHTGIDSISYRFGWIERKYLKF